MSRKPTSSGYVQSRQASSFQSIFPTLILYSNPPNWTGEYLLPFLEDGKGGRGPPPLQWSPVLTTWQITRGALLTSYSQTPPLELLAQLGGAWLTKKQASWMPELGIRVLAKGTAKNTECNRKGKGIHRVNKHPGLGGPRDLGWIPHSATCHEIFHKLLNLSEPHALTNMRTYLTELLGGWIWDNNCDAASMQPCIQ